MTPARVLLVDDHPWAGRSAEVVDRGRGWVLVRLDDGREAYAFAGQWLPLPKGEPT